MTEWDEAEQRVEKAHELYERGRWEEAVSELRAAIAINPYNGAWYFNLGLTLDMMDRIDEAIAAYRRALEMEPEDIEILNNLGTDCTRAGHYKESITHYRKIEQLDPSYEACYCNRIFAHAELGEHDTAEEMFYLARQHKEKCPLCFYNMGHSLFARGLYDRALWCWQQVLDLEPAFPQTHARMAEALWAKGQLPEAHQHFLHELRANPGDIDTLLDLGELLVEMGQPDAAGEKFRQTLELEPEEPTAHYHMGQLAMTQGDMEGALLQFRRVLRNDRNYAGAHLKLAQIYHRQGDLSETMYHANCELAQQKLDDETLLELGNLFMDLNQLGSAETAFQRILAANPQHNAARQNLAITLLLSERIEEGIEQCKIALRTQPKHMLVMHNLSLAYLTKGDFARARYWLHEALDIAPDDPQLKQLQTKLRLKVFVHALRALPGRIFGRKTS
jgi:tetratricopeptide (TPR) repeat protein